MKTVKLIKYQKRGGNNNLIPKYRITVLYDRATKDRNYNSLREGQKQTRDQTEGQNLKTTKVWAKIINK